MPICVGATNEYCERFLNCVLKNNLTQTVLLPTRGNNILDLLFTNVPSRILDITITEPFTPSCDHESITFRLHAPVSSNKTARGQYYNFRRADYDSINAYLESVNWIQHFNQANDNVHSFWDLISKELDYCIQTFVPFSKKNGNKARYPKNIRRLALAKKKTYKRCKTSINSKSKYLDLSRQYEEAVFQYNKNKEKTIIEDVSLNRFYSFVNGKLHAKYTVSALAKDDGIVAITVL